MPTACPGMSSAPRPSATCEGRTTTPTFCSLATTSDLMMRGASRRPTMADGARMNTSPLTWGLAAHRRMGLCSAARRQTQTRATPRWARSLYTSRSHSTARTFMRWPQLPGPHLNAHGTPQAHASLVGRGAAGGWWIHVLRAAECERHRANAGAVRGWYRADPCPAACG